METRILKAPDISCGHCERTIKNALASIPGVGRIEVDIPKREIHLDFDPSTVDRVRIETILVENGYPVASDPVPSQIDEGGKSCCGSCRL